ncbi:hypothetical protein TWF694_008156 [Orbilia ellipsospora]|uniref:Alpha-ketoglutarate-dependent dioxygenase AlkB-like domain-containing protein n=1 Tax=Orbilia ellipsospora TaxID=2528407 RepID=A0AAV9XFN7_9PEZI
MSFDTAARRSSRRLKGAPPLPPSPPSSEPDEPGGGTHTLFNLKTPPRRKKYTEEVFSPVSISEVASTAPSDVNHPHRLSVSERRVTRRHASEVTRSETGSKIDISLIKAPRIEQNEDDGTYQRRSTRLPIAGTWSKSDRTGSFASETSASMAKITQNEAKMKDTSNTEPSESHRETRSSKRKSEVLDESPQVSEPVVESVENGRVRRSRLPKIQKTEPPVIGEAFFLTAMNNTIGPETRREHPKKEHESLQEVEKVKKTPKLTARKNTKTFSTPLAPTVQKQPSIGKPRIWCDTRQELCESLPSFRSYQGGCYSSKGFGRGYLIDGHASERDYMDASIIISHAGGNSEEVEGQRRLVRDQTWDKGTIAYLRNNCEQMVPLAIIIGEKCPTAPAHLVHRYSVMDWFKVTHCWPERDSVSGKIRCKFRLEKLDGTKKGWWAAEGTPGVLPEVSIEYINCERCHQRSPWVYDDAPMCLNKDCERFWMVCNGRIARPPTNFGYRQSFLHGMTVWPKAASQPPGPLAPTLPIEDESIENNGRDVKRRFWKGVWCEKCGKLNCRELWKSWKCSNCDWEFVPKRSHFVPADLADPHRPEFTGPAIPENVVDPSIKSNSVILEDGRRVIVYEVFQCGKVIHIMANKIWNELPGGPDWLLDNYQNVDMPFKRHELKTHKLTGRLLTQQFSFNSGAPYKYIVEVDSLSFEDSPKVVQRALEKLQMDVTRMIPDALPMNEVLNVAYFEEQKMDFHDDGEEDLGPCVSSISLGSPAMMYFRVKGKYCSNDLSNADKALLRPSNLQYQNSTEEGKRPTKRNILEIRLHHGDVIIMDGRPIQRLLEHAVTPEGFRIAATARNISSRNVVVNSNKPAKPKARSENLGEKAQQGLLITSPASQSLSIESDLDRAAGKSNNMVVKNMPKLIIYNESNSSLPTVKTSISESPMTATHGPPLSLTCNIPQDIAMMGQGPLSASSAGIDEAHTVSPPLFTGPHFGTMLNTPIEEDSISPLTNLTVNYSHSHMGSQSTDPRQISLGSISTNSNAPSSSVFSSHKNTVSEPAPSQFPSQLFPGCELIDWSQVEASKTPIPVYRCIPRRSTGSPVGAITSRVNGNFAALGPVPGGNVAGPMLSDIWSPDQLRQLSTFFSRKRD